MRKAKSVGWFTYRSKIVFDQNQAVVQWAFCCNNAYDPDNTGVGTQPKYWSLMSQFYRTYSVLESTCTVTWTGWPGQAPMILCLRVADDVGMGAPADIEAFKLLPRVQSRVWGGYPATSRQHARWNVKTSGLERDDNTGTMGGLGSGSGPNDLWYYQLVAGNASNAVFPGAPNTPFAEVTLRYKVLFTSLIDV